jgi:hypothetical protein
MRRAALLAQLSVPSPPEVLDHLTDQALKSAEIEQALRRYGIAPPSVQSSVAADADKILDQVRPERQRYERAQAEARRALERFDPLSAWLLAAVSGYLALPPRPIDPLSGVVAGALLLIAVFRVLFRRTRRTVLADLASAARQQWSDALNDTALLPFIRSELSVRAKAFRPLATRLDLQLAPGLLEHSEPKHLVPSAAMRRIESIVGGMTEGSLGISGRRGIGKTTIMKACCSDRYPPSGQMPELRVLVSAPVDYDARDFVLHLFTRLCEAFQAADSAGRVPSSGRRLAVLATPRSAAGLIALAISGLVLVRVAAGPVQVTAQDAVRWGLTIAAAAAAVGGVLLITGWQLDRIRALLGGAQNPSQSMRDRTVRELSQLQFLQTLTTGSSASVGLGLPVTAQAGFAASRQLAEQTAGLPQLVARYVDYAVDVAAWWREQNDGHGRLVLGIDEVDRIRDSSRAEKFLNDIKAVFDVRHCFYLISLSEDAIAGYDRRALAVRSAFDSAFDEIVPVGPLSLEEAEELLAKRIIGLPRPFAALCWVLSGGLPRDLVRSARALINVSYNRREYELAWLATALAKDELTALKASYLTQAAAITDSDLLEQLSD